MTVIGKSGPTSQCRPSIGLSICAQSAQPSSNVPDQITTVQILVVTASATDPDSYERLPTGCHWDPTRKEQPEQTFLTISKPPLSVTR
jgi:hypothetical protein